MSQIQQPERPAIISPLARVGRFVAGAVGWVCGIALSLVALGAFLTPGEVGSGVIVLAAAALIIPPMNKLLRAKVPLLRPWSAPPLVALAAVAIAVSLAGGAGNGALTRSIKSPVVSNDKSRVAIDGNSGATANSQEIRVLWTTMVGATKPCDQASQKLADEVRRLGNGGFALTAYQLATAARKICWDASTQLRGLDASAVTPRVTRQALEKSIDGCATAYWAKSAAMMQIAEVLDGDFRPSKITSARQMADTASGQALSCALTFLAAAEEAGASLQ